MVDLVTAYSPNAPEAPHTSNTREVLAGWLEQHYDDLQAAAAAREKAQFAGDGGGGGGGAADCRVEHRAGAPRARIPEGEGLRRRFKGKGVADHLGVKPQVIYAPFGRYLINMVKLGDDIVTVCNHGGTKVSSLPTKRVSVDLANVLREIV